MSDSNLLTRLVLDVRAVNLPADQQASWLAILPYPARAARRFAGLDVEHEDGCSRVRPGYRYDGVRTDCGVVEVLECPVCHRSRMFVNGEPGNGAVPTEVDAPDSALGRLLPGRLYWPSIEAKYRELAGAKVAFGRRRVSNRPSRPEVATELNVSSRTLRRACVAAGKGPLWPPEGL
jgi:hypothetical protein